MLEQWAKSGVIIQHKSCCLFLHIKLVCFDPLARLSVCVCMHKYVYMILIYRIKMSVQKVV